MRTVLIVDDEQRMLDLVELFLLPADIHCIKAKSGLEALRVLKQELVDFVLLDIMMPEMDGWEVCKEIRKFSKVPIIMLTARTDKADLVQGLNVGADDYLTKPFDERELIARINAVLRRTAGDNEKQGTITFEHFVLSQETYNLNYNDLSVTLTLKEFRIVEALLSRPHKTFTREELMQYAWEFDTYTDIRTVDSHIRNLRDKLKQAGFPMEQYLKTVWGIGYKWSS